MRSLDSVDELSKMTKEEKCLLRCVMKKRGIIDENGALVEEELTADMEEDVKVDFSKCTLQTTITDPCEQNFVLTECIAEVIMEVAVREN